MSGSFRPLILSGIQPTGRLMLGNYLGALRPWSALQDSHRCFYTLVDLHAITVSQDPATFPQRCYSFIAQYLACGIDPERSTIFIQSQVPQHTELAWILNCFAYMGELGRMTQYKDRSRRHADNLNVGLFAYPVLMAADILLYQTNLVPVGEDQRQHLELCRNIAQRFNDRFGEAIFAIPEPFITSRQQGGRIMALQNPAQKMSKSDENQDNIIALLDDPPTLEKKIKRAVTDSGSDIRYDVEEKAGIANLITLYSCVNNLSIPQCEERFHGRMYGHLKSELAECVIEFLRPIRERYDRFMGDRSELDRILKNGARVAAESAQRTLDRVRLAMGFVRP